MQRYFIADLHLTDDKPVITAGFISFLNDLPDACELYILGDLFDYWVGDDVQTPLHQQVAASLNQLANRNIKTYFLCGNRDFLLGKRYAKACNMKLLPDINHLLVINDKSQQLSENLIFLHGDLLCTDDINYQKFRKKMHSKILQKLFLWLPLSLRKRIAQKLRQASKSHNQLKSDEIMDVNQQSVADMMVKYHASVMVHGHTHKPATHTFLDNNLEYKRIVLGAWHEEVSYIKQDDSNNSIEFYSHSFK